MQFIIVMLGSIIALGGCAKQAAEESPTAPGEEPQSVPISIQEEPAAGEVAPIEEEPFVEEDEAIEEITQFEVAYNEPVIVSQEKYDADEQELNEMALPDTAAYWYMIRPNDWLIKIASMEYGKPDMWSDIYAWNRDEIAKWQRQYAGYPNDADVNPDLIYPYNNLLLYKLESEITPFSSDIIIHTVASGETLWSIAGEYYSDKLAWIVIFLDNEEIITRNGGAIDPGMGLEIQSRLWPED